VGACCSGEPHISAHYPVYVRTHTCFAPTFVFKHATQAKSVCERVYAGQFWKTFPL